MFDSEPDPDPSVFREPQMRRGPHAMDPSESEADRVLRSESSHANVDDAVQYSVWDEPALSAELTSESDSPRLTYADWLSWRIKTTPITKTWTVTILVMLAAGPWAILGALIRSTLFHAWGILLVAVVAPVVEETMKIAVALWVVEKRPYLFRSPVQILLCCLAGGLTFSAIENFMYLWVYVAHPSAVLIAVRWTVCVALHVTCSLLAGIGLVRMWSAGIKDRVPPRIRVAAPWIVAAMITHGLYNAAVTIVELTGRNPW